MNRWIVLMAAAAVLGQPVSGFCMPAAAAAPTVPEKALQGVNENEPQTGKVLETMNSGGYTYINLELKDGKSAWFAVPVAKVTVGSTVTVKPGSAMGEFSSKSLKRKFDNIIFSPGLVGEKPEETTDKLKAMAHKGIDLSAGMKGDDGAAAEPMAKIKVEKAPGPDAYTVAEVFGKKDALAGKRIAVRGKVFKATAGIMGRSWIHLRDGSGDEEKKDNNLIVTSQTTPVVGEVVTIHGTVSRSKDFGAGYFYDLLIEDADIVR